MSCPYCESEFKVGSNVLLDGSVAARITAVFIRDNNRVTYEVVYWNNRDRKEEVVEAWEIQLEGKGIDPVL